jgi:SAM-dependent methyltransferase
MLTALSRSLAPLSGFSRWMLLVYALTLFTSATLLFLVQPLIGKMILPLLGGTPEVWNTCMVFFQAMLLAGYGYAHLSTKLLGPRKQAILHLFVLLLPFLGFLPIAVNRNIIQGGEAHPIPRVLLLLTVAVGVPFFVVSASAPMLQKWFASTDHPSAADPYFLYGASNVGSMLALFGYPTLVEPLMRLGLQTSAWAVGYGVLVLATAGCAWFLWKMAPASPTGEVESATAVEGAGQKSDAIRTASSRGVKEAPHRGRKGAGGKRPATVEMAPEASLSAPMTWGRRLRWVLLAAVPSSLMLGVTTYVTTDIAAIPLLWVMPLALYIFSFIIVFSRVPRWVHQAMILALPLLVLLVLFMMLSEIKPKFVGYTILLHLATLFVTAMVCHGEIARDRPATTHLTEYFFLMSVGGVLGGIFNGLIAPIIFNSLAEYQLAMMVACLLLPPLTLEKPSPGSLRLDLALAGSFVAAGVTLMLFRFLRPLESYPFRPGSAKGFTEWGWMLAGLLMALGMGAYLVRRFPLERASRVLDVVLPITLGLLTVGLAWCTYSSVINGRIESIASLIDMRSDRLEKILMFGLPAVLCYTFVERSFRFGLGVGAILLASAFCGLFDEGTERKLLQKRSFFGVLVVEKYKIFHKLVHGTTLHGQQYIGEDSPYITRHDPLTYYHRTGPIGQIMSAYSDQQDDSVDAVSLTAGLSAAPAARKELLPRVAVIGLGTGTMSCYAHPGQTFRFYDIDPLVRDIAQNPEYFTYWSDARERGADLDVYINDARLEIERQVAENKKLEAAGQPPKYPKYKILVVDAFSSDAIPIHLITREALRSLLEIMEPDGLICYHISNRYLDLQPVLANLAKEENLAGYYESDDSEGWIGKTSSTWVVLAREQKHLNRLMSKQRWEDERQRFGKAILPLAGLPCPEGGIGPTAFFLAGLASQTVEGPTLRAPWRPLRPDPKVGIWTDDYSNLLSVFSWPWSKGEDR